MQVSTARCGDCLFWFESKREEAFSGSGQCRRNAPYPFVKQYLGDETPFQFIDNEGSKYYAAVLWPITDIVDWCGEFLKNDSNGKVR